MNIGSFDNLPSSLPQLLSDTADRHPETGITLLDSRGREKSHRSFVDLNNAVRQAAGRWTALGVTPESPLLVCLPTSWEFIDAWLGAIVAGALPVAMAPPGALGSPEAQVAKGLRICDAIEARWLIAPQAFVDMAKALQEQGGSARHTQLITTDEFARLTPQQAPTRETDPEATAFLQLTSGSTGLPRAVEISHRSLIHNTCTIGDAIQSLDGTPCEHVVSWLPLYHDMGLIGCFTHSLLTGTPMDLLSPRSFLARPWIWLEAIARRHRAYAPAPNFAYQLCVERVSQQRLAQIDLSAGHHLFSGSEMVRPETVDAFLHKVGSAGFDGQRFRPCYGLAEATLGVTIDRRGGGARTRIVPDGDSSSVALGSPAQDVEVEIWPTSAPVHDTAEKPTALGPDQVGRVMLRSPGLMKGYYNDAAATKEAFDRGWLDTGDLGFLYDTELYLTGRSKEILILNGTNVMPHEIEWAAEAASTAGGSERCGAFSILTETGEVPILVLETVEKRPERIAEIEREIKTSVGRTLSIPLEDLVMVRRGSIPRTSSGKVQRRALKQMYEGGELSRVNQSACSDD